MRNSILWGNSAASGAQIYNNSGTPVLSDSVVEGGYIGGTNIITDDPLLGSLGNYGGYTQTIPLLPGSAAIDAGNATYCTTGSDQRNVSYVGTCDIGAFEYDYAGVYHVKETGSGTQDCQSWDNACKLQNALVTTKSGDEIWVMAGIHTPGTLRTDSFNLKDGVALYGGFDGTETARDQRDPASNVTTLSGDLNGDDDGFTNNDENSYHVVTGSGTTSTAILDGFTISGGNANGTSPSNFGGGMYNNAGQPTITNVTFSGNSAASNGGGMFNTLGSHSILTEVTFSGNIAGNGGGMANYDNSHPTLTNVTFTDNQALGNRGGGMYNYLTYGGPTLTNVTFSNNSAAVYGGGMSNGTTSNAVLTNVTFSDNSAGTQGGAIFNASSTPSVRNTNLWGNTAPDSAQIYNSTSTPVVSDSVIQGGYTGGTNIITADPMLGTLADNGGYTQTMALGAGSSAIDAGDDVSCPATDQRGVTRPQGVTAILGRTSSMITQFQV